MKSFTKTVFADEVVGSLVRVHLGTAVSIAHIQPLTAGWFNTAYAVELADGLGVVLRIAPDPRQPVLTYEQGMMARDAAFHRLAYEQLAIPVPRLLAYDASHTLLDRDFMLVERLPGVALDTVRGALAAEELTAVLQELGQVAVRIHAYGGAAGFGYRGEWGSWPEAFAAMWSALLDDGERLEAELPVAYTAVRERMTTLLPLLATIQQPRFVHWDLWDGNVIVQQVNGRWQISGIIDWERALWGDPDMDVVMFRGADDPFWQGYGRTPATDTASQQRSALYRLYLWLIMLIEDKVRFDGAEHIPWVRERFAEDWQKLQQELG